ncbi:MAG TPA: hypothetical protein EYP03_04545 [Aquificae bacterium]|nr:hypothetical protein [Aquificota bacterium]
MYVLREFQINQIIDLFDQDQILIYPTDTLYGLLGNVFKEKLIKKVIKIKHRPFNKPFLILISEKFLNFFYFPTNLKFLLNYKCTIITKSCHDKLNKIYKKIFNTDKIAFRVPKKYYLYKILKNLNYPLFAPSANISGFSPIKSVHEAKKYFLKDIRYFVKGNISKLPSTILEVIDKNKIKIIRKGADLEKILLECNKRGIKIQGANLT